jgi:hypothetical protein
VTCKNRKQKFDELSVVFLSFMHLIPLLSLLELTVTGDTERRLQWYKYKDGLERVFPQSIQWEKWKLWKVTFTDIGGISGLIKSD